MKLFCCHRDNLKKKTKTNAKSTVSWPIQIFITSKISQVIYFGRYGKLIVDPDFTFDLLNSCFVFSSGLRSKGNNKVTHALTSNGLCTERSRPSFQAINRLSEHCTSNSCLAIESNLAVHYELVE